MHQIQNNKQYDLEKRTFEFAKNVREWLHGLKRTVANIEDCNQLMRSSGSVGANYIEANESLSKKDFLMRAKICRKEAKESRYWLALLEGLSTGEQEKTRKILSQEATELLLIFSAIINKSE